MSHSPPAQASSKTPEPAQSEAPPPWHAPCQLPGSEDPYKTLQAHRTRAHQLRMTLHAADHYVALDRTDSRPDDHATAAWLLSCGLDLAAELSVGLDRLEQRLRKAGGWATFRRAVSGMRTTACQMHAVLRANTHFIARQGPDNQEVSAWLLGTARTLAQRIATELDDYSRGPGLCTTASGGLNGLDIDIGRRSAFGQSSPGK
jgi:hypothetical protein